MRSSALEDEKFDPVDDLLLRGKARVDERRPATSRRAVNSAVPINGKVTNINRFKLPEAAFFSAANDRTAQNARKSIWVERQIVARHGNVSEDVIAGAL